MKKLLCVFSLLTAITVTAFAQTQQGVVKTRGRMVNGQHVSGSGLTGAIVSIQGGNSYSVQDSTGSFSFPVPAKTFVIQRVQKSGYQLVDADVTRKSFQYSGNPLCLVMETPEQLMEDKLAAERKIRRTLQHQLEEKEDELETLKAQQRLTQEEYQKRLQQLYDEQKDNEKLISEMAQRYTELDYDRMSELNQQISDCILNGELVRADSLLRTKGDIKQRMEELLQHQQANDEMRDKLEKSEAMAEKEKEELAEDCYNRYTIFLIQHMNDSAAFYLELRAQIDTTNIMWQLEAANYLSLINEDERAELFYLQALTNAYQSKNGDLRESNFFNDYAIFCNKIGKLTESEDMYKKALIIRRQLSKESPAIYESCLATTLMNYGILLLHLNKVAESCKMTEEALTLRKRLYLEFPEKHSTDYALTVLNLANEYNAIDPTKSEEFYREALYLFEHQQNLDSISMKANRAHIYGGLAQICFREHREQESREYYQKCLSAYCDIAKSYPMVYMPILKKFTALKGSSNGYSPEWVEWVYINDIDRNQKLSDIYRLFVQYDAEPEKYKPNLARYLGNLSYYAILKRQFATAEKYAREGLQTDSCQTFVYANLATSLLFQGRYKEAKGIYTRYLNMEKSKAKHILLKDFDFFSKEKIIPRELETEVERIKLFFEEY